MKEYKRLDRLVRFVFGDLTVSDLDAELNKEIEEIICSDLKK